MLSRRDWLLGTGAVLSMTLVGSRHARADGETIIRVPHAAVGVVVSALAKTGTNVVVDDQLAPTTIAIDDSEVGVGTRLLLKGKGANRRRFLDDPRNAPKLALNVSKALGKHFPEQAADVETRRKAFSRQIAKSCLKWMHRLEGSRVAGKRVTDPHGRRYLLEWAGATIDSGAADSGPAALEKLPAAPASPTLEGYRAYIDRLVAALTK